MKAKPTHTKTNARFLLPGILLAIQLIATQTVCGGFAAWTFDDTYTNTVSDVTGRGSHLQVTNGYWEAGVTGGALAIHRNTRVTLTQADAALGLVGDFTVACWLYVMGVQGDNAHLISSTPASGQGGWSVNAASEMAMVNGGQFFYFENIRLGFSAIVEGKPVVILGGDARVTLPPEPRWRHVCLTRAGDTLRVYLDGSLSAESTVTGAITDGAGVIQLFRESEAVGVTGGIDELLIGDESLSEPQIQQLIKSGMAAFLKDCGIAVTKPTEPRKTSGKVKPIFSTDRPANQWTSLQAQGYSEPVTGVIYRLSRPPTCGMPLGGLDTGCVDLETSGLLGYSTIFNSHVPRRGPLNVPFLGLSVGGEAWVLCDPAQIKQYDPSPDKWWFNGGEREPGKFAAALTPGGPFKLEGVKTPREIHYWGHYPIADLEYETDAPVAVGLRAYSPFLPGDQRSSTLPGAVFEVQLHNVSDKRQKGSVALSMPGPLPGPSQNEVETSSAPHTNPVPYVFAAPGSLGKKSVELSFDPRNEAGAETFTRQRIEQEFNGCVVSAPKASYALGVVGEKQIRIGGELGTNGLAWAGIERQLPAAGPKEAGSSVAVDFDLKPGERRTVRFIHAWYSPQWRGTGQPAPSTGNLFTHMYARFHRGAGEVAGELARDHQRLLQRIIAWQEVIYADKSLPGWLQDSLINNLHLIAETGLWAQSGKPWPDWVKPEDGLFMFSECPRFCPNLECIPCSFYGNMALVYFYPELALSTLRGYKNYSRANGELPFIFGQVDNLPAPLWDAQITLNGICYASMVDRYGMCWGDDAFYREFYDSVKQNTVSTMNMRPQYSEGDQVISVPNTRGAMGNTTWFEAPEPGWFGLVPHVGGLHLAQLRIAERMARRVGDQDFAGQCRRLIEAGSASLEGKTWMGDAYLCFSEPETGRRSDLVFGYQLDGEWVARFHGLPGVFQPERVKVTLDTIRRGNIALSKSGAVNYAHRDGSPAPVGGYGTYSYFPPEVLMLAMNYIYEGESEFGVELARRCWENITCKWGYTWSMPNTVRGDVDTGQVNHGRDYSQDMMLWSLPAAIRSESFASPAKPGGLVSRVLKAAKAE